MFEVISLEALRDILASDSISRGIFAWDPIKESYQLFESDLKKRSTMICLHTETNTLFFLQSAASNRNLAHFDFYRSKGPLTANVMDDFSAFCLHQFGMRAFLWVESCHTAQAKAELLACEFQTIGSLPENLYSRGSYHAQDFLYREIEVCHELS